MRSLVLAAVLMAAPGTAFAGSFTVVADRAVDAGSITPIGVPAPQAAAAAPQQVLQPGHEVIGLKQVDGKTKIYRTEAWLGGSPVTFVTTATPQDLAALKKRGINVASSGDQPLAPDVLAAARPAGTPQIAGVDTQETTGSLDAVRPAAPMVDPASLKLRPLLGNS